MPKSTKPTRPSSSTSRLPAWTSAWKRSLATTLRAQVRRADSKARSGLPANRRTAFTSTNDAPIHCPITNEAIEH